MKIYKWDTGLPERMIITINKKEQKMFMKDYEDMNIGEESLEYEIKKN